MKVPCTISKSVAAAFTPRTDSWEIADSFAGLFDIVSEGVLVFNADSLCVAANRPACVLLDRQLDQLIGQSLFAILGVEKRELCRPDLAIERQRCAYPQWLALRLVSHDRNPFVVTCRDITRERQLEEQLLHSQRLQIIGQLTSGILHDVNNMSTVIRTCAELLQRGLPAGSPLARYSQNMVAAVDRSTQITRQLLNISRREPSDLQPIHLHEVVSEMIPLLHRLVSEQIIIEVHADPAAAAVKADPTQVAQVLLNLAVNSRDAMPEGGMISIRTADVLSDGPAMPDNILSPGRYVLLEVGDTGVGMSAEVQARIFDPFFTTKKHGKGSGLGLATVRAVVQSAGGCILVESEPGNGTRVQVYFPAVEPLKPVRAETLKHPGVASLRTPRSTPLRGSAPSGASSD